MWLKLRRGACMVHRQEGWLVEQYSIPRERRVERLAERLDDKRLQSSASTLPGSRVPVQLSPWRIKSGGWTTADANGC